THRMRARRIGILTCYILFQAEDGIRDSSVTGVQTCALPISPSVLPYQRTDESKADLRDSGHAWDWSAVFRVDAVAAVPNALTLKIGRASCREEGRVRIMACCIERNMQDDN